MTQSNNQPATTNSKWNRSCSGMAILRWTMAKVQKVASPLWWRKLSDLLPPPLLPHWAALVQDAEVPLPLPLPPPPPPPPQCPPPPPLPLQQLVGQQRATATNHWMELSCYCCRKRKCGRNSSSSIVLVPALGCERELLAKQGQRPPLPPLCPPPPWSTSTSQPGQQLAAAGKFENEAVVLMLSSLSPENDRLTLSQNKWRIEDFRVTFFDVFFLWLWRVRHKL